MLELTTYKNYKELVKALGWEEKKSNNRAGQMKQLDAMCKYHKEGQKFVIDEIYIASKEVIDGRYSAQYSPSYLVPKEHNDSIGVYSITLDNKIYIGSTISGFLKRFLGHRKRQNPLPTREMLDNGAVFNILQVCNGMDESSIRKIENDYIQEYKSNSNYEVVNVKDSWSFSTKEPKRKYKTVKVAEEDYEIILKIMEEKGIDYKL